MGGGELAELARNHRYSEVAMLRGGTLDDTHGTSADQVSAGHVDVDGPIGHRRHDVVVGSGNPGVCA